MPYLVPMPKPGEMTEECALVRWRKKEGDPVAKGDILFEIETDKAEMEVESFWDGILLKIAVPEGVTVPVQTIVGYIGQPGEVLASADGSPSVESSSASHAPEPQASGSSKPTAEGHTQKETRPNEGRLCISPRAAHLVKQSAIDPSVIQGSGPGGRIVEKDVRNHLKAAVEAGEAGKQRPLTRMRKAIAQRVSASLVTIPHFFVTTSVDMTDLLALRDDLKKQGTVFLVNDFIIGAVVPTLREFPDFNNKTDGTLVYENAHVNLGFTVSVEGGVVIPVLRQAEQYGLKELHSRIETLVEKARVGKLSMDELSGGTFTISNMGMMNVENFCAIINPGETAILAVSSAIRQPALRKEQITIRSIMKITLSVDHRLIDGVPAAQFANAVKDRLENAEPWRCKI